MIYVESTSMAYRMTVNTFSRSGRSTRASFPGTCQEVKSSQSIWVWESCADVILSLQGRVEQGHLLESLTDRIPVAGDTAGDFAFVYVAQGYLSVHKCRTGGINRQSLVIGSLTGTSIPLCRLKKVSMIESVLPTNWVSDSVPHRTTISILATER